jgi:hypothetical protein
MQEDLQFRVGIGVRLVDEIALGDSRAGGGPRRARETTTLVASPTIFSCIAGNRPGPLVFLVRGSVAIRPLLYT